MATNPNPMPSPKPTVYLQDMEELEIVFKRFDANDDGKISATELSDVMKALGSETSTEEVSRMMEEIDTDQDGFINLKEFADFCKGGWAADGGVGELRDAFQIYDQDKNGLISPNELRVVLNRLGEKCSEQDCSKMIKSVKSVDSDSDDNVNFDEFKKMMTNSATRDGDTSRVKHMN